MSWFRSSAQRNSSIWYDNASGLSYSANCGSARRAVKYPWRFHIRCALILKAHECGMGVTRVRVVPIEDRMGRDSAVTPSDRSPFLSETGVQKQALETQFILASSVWHCVLPQETVR